MTFAIGLIWRGPRRCGEVRQPCRGCAPRSRKRYRFGYRGRFTAGFNGPRRRRNSPLRKGIALARPTGLEPVTGGLEIRCSIL
jgi:hypothetical protein